MSTLILPPRFEDRGAELEATVPLIPIYEEVSGSLRPTWLPVDPTTFVPPPPRRSRMKTFATVSALALVTWTLGFAAVVGGHALHERYENRSSAATLRVAEEIAPPRPAQTQAPASTPAATRSSESSVTLTVNVNDLPISKDFKAHGSKARNARGSRGRDAGS